MSEQTERPTNIYQVDINGDVQYWVFAYDPANALNLLVEEFDGFPYDDEEAETVCVTQITHDAAEKLSINTDTEKGIQSLARIYDDDPGRALVACSEW